MPLLGADGQLRTMMSYYRDSYRIGENSLADIIARAEEKAREIFLGFYSVKDLLPTCTVILTANRHDGNPPAYANLSWFRFQ